MKLMSPKAFYYTVGKKNFFQYILFGIFVLFFYLPLMNLCMLAFADKYEVPAIIPQKFGFRWWEFVLGQGSLLSSIATSFVLAAIVTAVSLLICIPAAYALARYNFKGKRVFLLSFLLSNAYPRMGLYISIGILFYRLNLMGTFVGVIIIHVLNSMMFMTWIPSGAFRGVYRQQEESARDAGAGPFRTFFRITLPHCRCQCVHLPGIPGGGPGNAAGGLPPGEDHAGGALRSHHGISADGGTGAVTDPDHTHRADPVPYAEIHQCR